MTWNIDRKEHRVFPRNPLIAVIVNLQFHPILKVPEKVPDFQERVRQIFPVYQEVASQIVNMQPLGTIELRAEKIFSFRKADNSAGLSLTTTSLSLESRRHESRKTFIGEARVGFEALRQVHDSVTPVRLGLRYVNLIDTARIGQQLGRKITWRDVVSQPFLAVPGGLADLDGTLFGCEVASSLSPGGMTLRYGLFRDPADNVVKFRFDVDRYVEGTFDAARVVEHLESFTDEIFSVFIGATGPTLREWMEKEVT